MPAERSEQVIAVEIGSTGNGRSPIFNGRRQPSSGGTSRMMREYQVRNLSGTPGENPRVHSAAADPWRTPQARHRYRTDQRGQVHGQATRPAVPGLEDIPPQPRGRDRCDGYVRRADKLVSPALWIADHGARPATYSLVWCHSASNRRMDRKSGRASMRVGT